MKEGFQADYAKCADVGTKSRSKGIIVPGLYAFLVRWHSGFARCGSVRRPCWPGSLASGILTAALLANTGGAWKHTEKSNGRGSFKDAAVIP
jgi:K(+)-stimulated pyrophosphate-energized sodium pump